MKGMKDYFSGGNQIPWWLSGISFYMASFSVFAFVSFSALAYMYGWVAVTLFWMCVPGTVASVLFFAKRWRRARIDSPVEYLETRYSSTVRQMFAWQGLPVRVIDDSLKLIAIGIFVATAFNLPLRTSMICSGLIMLAYTMMGGLWAVAVTDFIQFIILSMAVLALIPLSLHEVGGIQNFIATAPEGFFKFTNPNYSWLYIAVTFLLYVLAYSSLNWALIQRYYCVPKEKDAYKVGALVIVLQIIGPPLMFLPAMAARKFLPDLAESAQAYPALCLHLLPVGMVGLVTAAMFSATLSMLSGDYNVCASVLTNDVYRRMIRPNATQKECVVIGRLMTLLVGGIVITLAVSLSQMGGEGLVRNMFKLFGVATAPVAIPMMSGLLFRKVTNRAAIAGFIAGIIVGLIVLFNFKDGTKFLGAEWKVENMLLVSTTFVTALVLTIVSFLPRKEKEDQRINGFFERLETPIGGLPEDDKTAIGTKGKAFSPFRIISVCIIIIGFMMAGMLPYMKERIETILVVTFAVLLLVGGFTMFIKTRDHETTMSK